MAKSATTTTTTIQVQTNLIENYLLETIGNHPHANTLVESIMAIGKSSGKLGYIFMATLGVTPQQNFIIGDLVNCEEMIYDNWISREETERRAIGQCRVVDYSAYDTRNYQIEFHKYKSDGTSYITTQWVEECELSEIIITKSL